MVVSVEISGILEKKLRRLVELGVYSSVAEAVREAVRRLFEDIDLKSLAIELYIERGASLSYAAEFAEETIESMIDYMLSKGVTPVIGGIVEEDYEEIDDGVIFADPLSLYVIYKSNLASLLDELFSRGLILLAPAEAESYLQILVADRIRRGLPVPFRVETVRLPRVLEEHSEPPLSTMEVAAVEYSLKTGTPVLLDDARARDYARKRGARAYSTLSLVTTYISRVGSPP
ncbi:MAG TPA: hypothetical protein EYP33_00405, partial [Pyrodictium sp.]|nr:hypothetical protein [Pyrodictium sp.]